MPPDTPLPFPPVEERRPYKLEVPDAWAVIPDLSEYSAFLAFGPAGHGDGDFEPASAWQAVAKLLRDAIAGGRGMDRLKAAVRKHIDNGDLYIDPETVQMRAKTLAALFASTAYSDLKAGRKLGRCQTCNRRMVLMKPKQLYCSTTCRVRGSREKNQPRKEA